MNRRDDPSDEDERLDDSDPDYPLSEAAGYSDWEPPERPWLRPMLIA